jgi:beta-glucosidase
MLTRALLLTTLALSSLATFAQAPHPLSAADQQHIEDLIHKMSLDQKLDYIGGTGFGIRAVPELGLPAINMSDGPYGTRSNSGFPSTTYAAGIGLAASWDPALAARVGGGIGRDARARDVHYMLGPGVNIYRSPRNGRNFEYFGEDPFLASQIAVGYIEGMQKQGVSATIKHFLANNSEFLRHDSNSIVDERALRELYLPAFEAGVTQAHVGAIMDSYNLINGQHATQNGYFNTDIVRNEWHYPYVVMSDWDATYDGIAAANGGLDIEEPTGKFMNRADLSAAIKSGKVTEATIDLKLRHLLTTDVAFDWISFGPDGSVHARNQQDPSISVVDAANNTVALDSARESIVLLKNDGHILPLDKTMLKTVLVVGPNAYPGVAVGGGSAGVVPFHLVSDVEGLTTVLGPSVNVLYDRGLPTLGHLANNTSFTTKERNGEPGVTLESFANDKLEGKSAKQVVPHITLDGLSMKDVLANLEALMPVLFNSPPKSISHRFTGFYNAAKDGRYVVTLENGGEGNGARIYVDDKLVYDGWAIVRAFQPTYTLTLSAGPHKVVVEEWQHGIIGGHMLFAITPASEIVDPHAVELASKADVVLVAAGFQQESESEGGDRTFSLPYGEDELINAMASANPKTIVDITAGGNVDSNAWLDHVPAVLQSWYGGQQGGTALAEVLTGKIDPSGHLPVTFERHAEDNPTFADYYPAEGSIDVHYNTGIYVGYRGYEKAHTKPLFPFGYGLSYTTFKLSKLTLTPELSAKEPHVTVSFDITNTGKVSGAEVAQVYVSDNHAPVDRPEHELKGFERVELAAGQTKHVSVTLTPRSFAYYDVAAKKWTIAPGDFTINVGDNLENLTLHATVRIPATEVPTSTF